MKKNLQLILAAFLFCLGYTTKAQFILSWDKGIGSNGSEKVLSTAIDGLGNVISTGYFQGTVDFDPGAGVFNLTSAGSDDIFVLKLDKNGNFVWARRMGGSSAERGQGVAIDGNDDVFVTGWFNGKCDFDPTSSNTTLIPAGFEDAYIVKIDNGGNFQWVHQIGGPDPDMAFSIAVDFNNDVACVGSFENTCDFDYGNSANITATAKKDAFICKVDGAGTYQWAREVQSPENEEAYGIATDSNGDWYVTGYFEDNCFFDPTAANINLKSAGLQDGFIFRADNGSGKFLWAVQIGLANLDIANGITVDANDEVYITGRFDTKSDFDPNGSTFVLSSVGAEDAFVCKTDNQGTFMWARNMGGSGNDVGYSIDSPNDIYVTGSFVNTANFNPSGTAFNLTSAGLKDIFVSQFDAATGKHLLSANMGGTADDEGLAVSTDAPAVYLGGYFKGTADFDPSAGTANLTSAGIEDVFLAKYAPCAPATMSNFTASSNTMCVGKTGTLTVTGVLNTATGWQLYSGSCGGSLIGTYTSNSFTVSPASNITYYVRPTGGCASANYTTCLSKAITVNNNPTVSVTSSASGTVCAGSSVTLTASGATTYSWMPGSLNGTVVVVTPTTNITYTATGITAGCSGLTTQAVTVSALPTITLTATPSVACAGQSPTITVTGGLTSYTWSTGSTSSSIVVSPTVPTNYSINGTNGFCSNSKSILINVSANPTITAVTNLSVICVGQSATLTANGAATYTWNTSSNSSQIVVNPTATTSYTVTGANGFGCQSAPVVLTQSVSTCLGLNEINWANNSVVIYPNPNNGLFNVSISDIHNNPVITIFDAIGRQVMMRPITENQTSINISEFSRGIYVFKVSNNNGELSHGKIIKE